MSDSQLAERPSSVKDYLALPAYRDRFHEVMGKRANQFMAAIVASSQLPGLKDAEPRSVIAAAMVAATLDLPVNPTLGQAHLVAYADGNGTKVAQFQIGYKGLIQLALRSGQYKRLNAGPVNEAVFKGYDLVGEPSLDWNEYDPTMEVAGYFCAFETLNGFIKVVYWSRAQAEAHAKRFSRAYAKGYSTPWKSDFDSMATKTVIKAALGKWGLLSVEMQKAVVHDQGAQTDVDAEVKYVDGGEDKTVNEAVADAPPVDRPAPPKRAAKGAAAVIEQAEQPKTTPKNEVVGEIIEEVKPQPKVEDVNVAMKTREAKLVEKAPEPAKVVEPAAPAAPATQPRAFLKDGEEFTGQVEVTGLGDVGWAEPILRDGTKKKMATVVATVKGDYNGKVFHFGGANDQLKPNPEWAVGNKLQVSLYGKQLKNMTVQARVESVQLAGTQVEAE